MQRRLATLIFNVLAAASALLLLTILLLWPRSYFRAYSIGFVVPNHAENSRWIYSQAGRLFWCEEAGGREPEGFHAGSEAVQFAEAWASWGYFDTAQHTSEFWEFTLLGFRYFVPVPPDSPMYPRREVQVPMSLCAVATAVLPLLWLRKRRQLARPRDLTNCTRCGYDLRAHSPGDRCPECGQKIPTRA